jgi:hypothetical protein
MLRIQLHRTGNTDRKGTDEELTDREAAHADSTERKAAERDRGNRDGVRSAVAAILLRANTQPRAAHACSPGLVLLFLFVH